MGEPKRFYIEFDIWFWLGFGINWDFGLELAIYLPFTLISIQITKPNSKERGRDE